MAGPKLNVIIRAMIRGSCVCVCVSSTKLCLEASRRIQPKLQTMLAPQHRRKMHEFRPSKAGFHNAGAVNTNPRSTTGLLVNTLRKRGIPLELGFLANNGVESSKSYSGPNKSVGTSNTRRSASIGG